MTTLKKVVANYQQLHQEWSKKPCNLDKCGQLLGQLKIALTQLAFLPTANTTASKQELMIARDVLEIGAQWSICRKDIPSFERYMSQLKYYYMDYKDELLESAYKHQLLGLNLLCLLAQNRVAEFHTELELLPTKEILNNVYIRHPVSLEQYLMEGSYNKIFLAKGNVPSESYNYFIDMLLDTIRDEIAGCIKEAYGKIRLDEATRMLFLANKSAMQKFATKKEWLLKPDNYYHFTVEEKADDNIPSFELTAQAIEYAKELEMIV